MCAKYVCSACGKNFDVGAFIIGRITLCPDCSEEFEELVDAFVSEYMLAELEGKQKPNLDEYIKKHEDTIKKLRIRPSKIKAIIITNLINLHRRL